MAKTTLLAKRIIMAITGEGFLWVGKICCKVESTFVTLCTVRTTSPQEGLTHPVLARRQPLSKSQVKEFTPGVGVNTLEGVLVASIIYIF